MKKKLLIPLTLFITACNASMSASLNVYHKLPFSNEEKFLEEFKESNYSFPSGHAMCSMVGYGLWIIELQTSNLKNKKIYQIC